MVFFIDFDGTICPNTGGPPHADCIDSLKKLKECNHQIFIYSCRSNPSLVDKNSEIEMIKYLDLYEVPYDGIIPKKPLFNYIIDDRAIGVPLNPDTYDVNWTAIKENLIMGNHIYG
jgi:hypothetical protein